MGQPEDRRPELCNATSFTGTELLKIPTDLCVLVLRPWQEMKNDEVDGVCLTTVQKAANGYNSDIATTRVSTEENNIKLLL